MQDFVEKFVKEKQAELEKKSAGATAEQKEESARERDARLIRLGMCRREYTDATTYSEEYPYQEYKTGKFYRDVAFAVTDEEYRLICRYDDTPLDLAPARPVDRLLGRSAKKYRAYAVTALIAGLFLAALLALIFYLLEDSLLIALAVGIAGIVIAFLFATLFHATGETLAKVDYLVARAESADLGGKKEEP